MKDSLGLTPQDYEAALANFRLRFKVLLEDSTLTDADKVNIIAKEMDEEPNHE